MSFIMLILGMLLAFFIYGIVLYNNFIALKNTVAKHWANIDVLLKQRNSEIPKLIETCKEYMQFEQETLIKVLKAREAAMQASTEHNIAALGAAESDLHTGLIRLFALAENYPDLKTNKSFLQLQSRISDLENAIADRRELYNDSVNLYNIRLNQFPDLIVAKLFAFHPSELLKFEREETSDVNVGSLFKQ